MLNTGRYRGMSRAEILVEAEKLRERDSLRDLLASQIAKGTAIGYVGRAEGSEYEYLLEANFSRALDAPSCAQETCFEASTRKVVSVHFYDGEAFKGARSHAGMMGGSERYAWIDAYDRIMRTYAERIEAMYANKGSAAA